MQGKWVEFHNEDKEVVIRGGSQVLLSELITRLALVREDGEAFTVDDVERVSFETAELFEVEEVFQGAEVVLKEDEDLPVVALIETEHDFLITSLKPFDEDQMIITLKDGTVVTVNVTDSIESNPAFIMTAQSENQAMTVNFKQGANDVSVENGHHYYVHAYAAVLDTSNNTTINYGLLKEVTGSSVSFNNWAEMIDNNGTHLTNLPSGTEVKFYLYASSSGIDQTISWGANNNWYLYEGAAVLGTDSMYEGKIIRSFTTDNSSGTATVNLDTPVTYTVNSSFVDGDNKTVSPRLLSKSYYLVVEAVSGSDKRVYVETYDPNKTYTISEVYTNVSGEGTNNPNGQSFDSVRDWNVTVSLVDKASDCGISGAASAETKITTSGSIDYYTFSEVQDATNHATTLKFVKGEGAGEMFVSKIMFFDVNSIIHSKTSTSPMQITGTLEAPTLTKNYYLLAVLKDNDGNELGWAVNPVDLSGHAETTTAFYAFHEFEETPGDGGRGSATNTQTMLYSSSNNTVETRLYNTDSALPASNQTYAYLKEHATDHPEEGYEFGGNFINSLTGENEIHLKVAPADKKYFVRVYFDEEAQIGFASEDGYYVNVQVTHASSVDSYQGDALVTTLSDSNIHTDSNGNKYVEFNFTNWETETGTQMTSGSYLFTGYEDSILVELIYQWKETYVPKYNENNAKPVPEGTLAKAYRVHYDTKQTNPKDTPTGFYEDRTADHVYCYDYIDLMTISATDDYDFNTILGPNVGYGIVADHLFQGNDLQTNFAVNHYSAHGHYVSPDLSGESSGAIVIGEFNVVDGMAENGTGAVAYDDTWGRLPIGNVLNNTLIVYADDDTGYNAPDGNVSDTEGKAVVVVHSNGEDLKANMVQPGIDYGIAMSNALMSHPDTFVPPIAADATSGTLDTTGFPDGATIYVDGDNLTHLLATSGALTIKKIKNQTIVFNFDTTRDLLLTQFKVDQYKYNESGVLEQDFPILTTSTDTANGTDQNKKMDEISRHIVWNLNGVKGKTTVKEGGGIYLQPNKNSEIDIAATSGGWIVSNGFVYNSSAEWHNFFVDMPDTNKLNLKAIKTVDGKIPRAGQQFEFYLKEYNSAATDESEKWTLITTQRNTNANISFPEMRNLSEGWHVYKIHENTSVPTGEGIEAGLYIVDQTNYYAVVHVTKTTDSAGVRYIITPPTYYKNFEPTKFSAENGPQEGAFTEKVTAATFDNEAVKQGLTIEKKVTGTTDTTKRFTFEIELKDAADQPLAGPYNYTVSNVAGTKTLTLGANGKGVIVLRNGQKATIEGLPVGTKYTVTETKVGTKVISDTENQDINGYVDGYQTPTNAISEEIEADNIAIASFTNVYHAAGSVSLKAKKVMHNAEGEEVELQDQQFRFTLTPLNSAVATPETVLNDAQGNVTFSTLSFTEADMTGAIVLPNGTRVKVLIFYVSESDGDLTDFNYGNVTYDGTKIVAVTLTDDGAGHITATTNQDNLTVHFNNVYEKKAAGTLTGTKKLTGRDLESGEFTFTARLYKTVVASDTVTYPTNETITTTKWENSKQVEKESPNPDYVSTAFATPTKLTGTNAAGTANESGAKPVATGAITFPTVHYLTAGEYYYQITENTGLGELPMGVTATPVTYYAKVTVPPAPERTSENTLATVAYYSNAECTDSITSDNVIFENEQKNINFTVTKSWTDKDGEAKNAGYSIKFSVKKNGQAYPIEAKHLEIVSGTNEQVAILNDGTVQLTGNASGWPVVKIKNVPEATYVVTETLKTPAAGDSGEYHTTYTVGAKTTTNYGTITEDNSALTIYNTQGEDKYTSITVEKKWKAGETEYIPESGSVTFELWAKISETADPVLNNGTAKVMDNYTDKGRNLDDPVSIGQTIVVEFTASFASDNDRTQFYNNVSNYSEETNTGEYTGDGAKMIARYYDGVEFNGSESNQTIKPTVEGNRNSGNAVLTYRIPTNVKVNNKYPSAIKLGEYSTQNWTPGEYTITYESEKVVNERDEKIDTYTISAPGWSRAISGLLLERTIGTDTTTYRYYVKEISTEGKYQVEYSPAGVEGASAAVKEGKITITNTKESILVNVNKQWKFPNGTTTWPTGVTVGVKLQNNGADVSGKTATLDAAHPSVTFDDLDKDGNYTVVETETEHAYTGDLISLISGDASTGFTITNLVNDTDVTVQKTWKTGEEPNEDWTATFKLQKARVAKIADSTGLLNPAVDVTPADAWQDVDDHDSITISKNGANPVTLTGLDVYEKDGDDIYTLKYQVVETNLTIGDSNTNRIDSQTGDYLSSVTQVGEAGNSYAIKVNNRVDDTKTSIMVEKVWQGDANTGTATMVLYRTTGENAAVPTNKFVVNVSANLNGVTPVGSANITATFSGDDGSTNSVTLAGPDWTGSVALDRGVSYSVAYSTNNSSAITELAPVGKTSDITDASTLTVNATAVAAQQYTYTFTVPGTKPDNGKGSVDVSFNGVTKALNSGNNWTVEFTDLPEESAYSYTVSGDNFITTVEPTSGEGTVSGNETINLTLTPAAQTMDVPVSVDWASAPDAGTTVTVTFTNGSTSETVTLSDSNWSTTKTLDRLDDNGDLITWNVTAEASSTENNASVSGAPATISDSGSVMMTGEVARGMTVIVRKQGTDYINICQLFRTNEQMTNAIEEYDNIQNTDTWKSKGVYTKTNLPVVDDNNKKWRYGIWYYSNISVNTTAKKGGLGTLYNRIIWFEAEPGTVIIDVSLADEDSYTGNVNLNSSNSAPQTLSASRTIMKSSSPRRLSVASPRLASNGASGSSGSKKFYDPQVETSPAPDYQQFTAIQAKDLPAGATIVPDEILVNSGTTTAVASITGAGSLTWSNLPSVDENGNPIYYYVVEKDATADADRMSVRYSYEYNTEGDPSSGIKKVTITNTSEKDQPQTGSLRFTKYVKGIDAGNADDIAFQITGPNGFSLTFTWETMQQVITGAGGTYEFVTNTDPMYRYGVLGNLAPGTYTVTETNSNPKNNGGYYKVVTTYTVNGGQTPTAGTTTSVEVSAGETSRVDFTNTYTELREYAVQKRWIKDNVTEQASLDLNYAGVSSTWFNLYRQTGETGAVNMTVEYIGTYELSSAEKKTYSAKVNTDAVYRGTAYDTNNAYPTELTKWFTVVKDLPVKDANGNTYEYFVLESLRDGSIKKKNGTVITAGSVAGITKDVPTAERSSTLYFSEAYCPEYSGKVQAIKNWLTHVKATKVWEDSGDTNMPHPAITLHLNKKVGDADPAQMASNYDKTIAANASGDALTVDWGYLPAYDYATGAPITYSVSEESLTGFDSEVTQLSYDATQEIYTYQVNNTWKTVKLQVEKRWQDESGNPLAVADLPENITFDLYRKGATGPICSNITVNKGADNKFLWKSEGEANLVLPMYYMDGETQKLCDYYVIEKDLPFGFRLIAYAARPTGGEAIELSTASGTISESNAAINSGEITLTNQKFSTVSLPATGGMGTGLIYATGVGLLLLAVIGWVLREKRRAWRG